MRAGPRVAGHGLRFARWCGMIAGREEPMSPGTSTDSLLFEGFRLEPTGLFRVDEAGGAVPVSLGSRALDLLHVLAQRPGEIVSKDTIMDAVWPGLAIEEGNLTVQISALRRAIDRDRAHG